MATPPMPNGTPAPAAHPRVTITAIPTGQGQMGLSIETNLAKTNTSWKAVRDILIGALRKVIAEDDKIFNELAGEPSRIVRPDIQIKGL